MLPVRLLNVMAGFITHALHYDQCPSFSFQPVIGATLIILGVTSLYLVHCSCNSTGSVRHACHCTFVTEARNAWEFFRTRAFTCTTGAYCLIDAESMQAPQAEKRARICAVFFL